MACLTFCKFWTAEDAAADADEIKIEGKIEGDAYTNRQSNHDEIVIEVKEVDQQDEAAASEVAAEDIPQAEGIREVPPTAEEVASATDVEVKEASKEAAPASGDGGVLTKPPPAEVVKRVDGDLMEGGLLLTQVVGGRKALRRLEVDRDSGILKWEVEAVFGMKWEKVKLSEARMMCTNNLVKIGVEGRREFLEFEACDEDEATAVCNALVGHAKKYKTEGL